MILTTTNSIDGKQITNYLGIIIGTTYTSNTSSSKGMSFKDMFNSTKYYENYEKGLEAAKESAFEKLKAQATEKQANAIVGITVDIEMMSTTGVTMISVIGTAVRVH
ncbi:heavy metal-binding domain-containing protein [uncultured Dokdonia sp.]|uniref:YbjQ family protein n=1 Tax=uncultured Dokdonia sp. TaxID=575653 RepID=UPI00261FBD95|nr:heavy metal-binding domain-containing protein [uncultured Dokdonia sp.]